MGIFDFFKSKVNKVGKVISGIKSKKFDYTFLGNSLVYIFYDIKWDGTGEPDGVVYQEMLTDNGEIYFCVNKKEGFLAVKHDGGLYTKLIMDVIKIDALSKSKIAISCINKTQPHIDAVVSIMMNKPPVHPIDTTANYITFSVLGNPNYIEPEIRMQFVLKNLTFNGSIEFD